MKKYCINEKMRLVMYCYFRQIHMSIDSVKWFDWKHVQEYYTNQIKPQQFVQLIFSKYNICEKDINEFELK